MIIMREFYYTMLALSASVILSAQVKDVTLRSVVSKTIFTLNDTLYVPIEDHILAGNCRLVRFEQDLTIIDTIDLAPTNMDSVHFYGYINQGNDILLYNGKDKSDGDLLYSQRVSNGKLVDSVYINLDTIKGRVVDRFYHVDSNSIIAPVIKVWPPGGFPDNSVIVEMDSNFVIRDYHTIDFNQPGVSNSYDLIESISILSDSLWHIHGKKGVWYSYNPIKHVTLGGKNLVGTIQSHYKITADEYLGFGTAAKLTIKGQPGSAEELLGFYRVNANGHVVDTAAFTFKTDSSLFPSMGRLDFVESNTTVPNAVVIDTNNIYLAADANFWDDNAGLQSFLYVVKTDSRGAHKWSYVWKSLEEYCFFRGIVSTSDGGCIVSGLYFNQIPFQYANLILIKLGPDGTISNVEFNAPETVVSFYPNPVKDRLHYSMLEAGNGPYLLEVHNMQGKPVLEAQLSDEENHIPVNLSKGFYLYQLKSEAGKVEQVGKLVVE